MIAGLPGTGIGGLFYALLVAWMPLRELWLALRGRSGLQRWRLIGFQTSLAAGIVAALWVEAWLLKRLFAFITELARDMDFAASVLQRIGAYGTEFIPPALALAPFVILSVLVLSLHLLRLVARRLPAGTA